MISLADIERARLALKPYIYPTPLLRCFWLEELAGVPVYCKLENLQRTGSFKMRGATNRLLNLDPAERAAGVVTASAGNHGLGVAQAAQLFNCPATIFVPTTASSLKVRNLRQFGVTLIQEGSDYDDAEELARNYATVHNLSFIHAFEQSEIIAGQGTIGLELLEQMPEPNAPMCVVIPVGGGGLMGGVAIAIKSQSPRSRIIGVQSEASPAMERSLAVGKVVETPIADTIADGLAGRFVTEKSLRLAQQFCDEMLLVRENSMRLAIKEFHFRQGWRLEGSAAVGAAAILENKVRGGTMPIVLIISGGNIADKLFEQIIAI
ncbi:MAG: threonine/serine dehydratase [candidate division KSB1 bacterium]|nr:threonine/serine dehydratase [candidate division KSB1 bacterium]MDZ7305254.1 threonine/serine dehydratase [candidate division KSB1 bacterium]MDZ7314380.1 threonine/serine dehydratase [candidate division KSB1 bacterium]